MATRDSQTEPVRPFAAFLTEQFAQRTKRPVADLSRLSKTLRVASQQLEGNPASPYLDSAANKVDSLARLLRSDPDELLSTLRGFALAQPGYFLGGAVLTGFGAARILRAQPNFKPTIEHAGPRKRAARATPKQDQKNGGTQ
jgi:hypothetical protein